MRKLVIIAAVSLFALLALSCAQEFGVTDVSPSIGSLGGGESVAINGSGFVSGMGVSVYFGNRKAENVVVNSSNKITVSTPGSSEEKKVDVRVTTDDGKSFVIRDGFTYVEKAGMDLGDLGTRKSARESQK